MSPEFVHTSPWLSLKSTDYGGMMAKSQLPKLKFQPQIWDFVSKAYVFVEIMVDKWKTCTRNSQFQNRGQKYLKKYRLICLAKP